MADEHTWGGRVTGLFKPNEQLDISALIYLERQQFDGFNDITGGAGNPNDALVQQFISDTPEPQENQFDLYNITVKYRFDRFNSRLLDQLFPARSNHLGRGNLTGPVHTHLFRGASHMVELWQHVERYHQSVYNFSQEARLAT